MLALRRFERGDTIVEVLITIAIISLVLVGAYASTNKNIAQTQDAQERNQASKLAQKQVEYLNQNKSIAAGKCFDQSGTPQTWTAATSDPCTFSADGNQAGGAQPAYQTRIVNIGGTYAITLTWDNAMGTGRDNLVLYYRPPSV